MKIEIELLNEVTIYKPQMLAVDKYIINNTIKVEESDFLGIVVSQKPVIKETPENTGLKIELDGYHRSFHVSCRKTKSGVYKFKVWNA